MAETLPSPGFFDGLGDRVIVEDRTTRPLEVLRLRGELASDEAFDAAVRSRAQQFAALRHPGLSVIRHVGRLPAPDRRLAIISDFVDGVRLSEVLQATAQLDAPIHTNAVLFLVRQLVEVVAKIHEAGTGMAHGALGPERLVVTPTGRLVVVESVLGSALAQGQKIPPHKAWKDMRLAIAADEQPPFGQRTDVLQVGLCALSLVLGRPLRIDEYPFHLVDLLDHATESKVTGERRPLRQPLRSWLERCLGVGGPSRWTIGDAKRGLDDLVSHEGYLCAPTGVVQLMQRIASYYEDGTGAARNAGEAAPAAPRGDLDRLKPAVADIPRAAAGQPPAMAPAPVASVEHVPERGARIDGLAHPAAGDPKAPLTGLRLVSPATREPSVPARDQGLAVADLGAGATRTEGALAVAVPVADLEDIAPESGIAFPPEEPEVESVLSTAKGPGGPRAAVSADPPKAARRAAPEAAGEADFDSYAGAEPRGPQAPADQPPIKGETFVEPIAAAIERDDVGDGLNLNLSKAGHGSGAHRAESAVVRASRSLLGAADVNKEPGASRGAGRGMPLKIVAAAAGVLAAVAAGAWLLIGGGDEVTHAAAPAPAAAAAKAPAPPPKEAEVPPVPQSGQSDGVQLPPAMAAAAAVAYQTGSVRITAPIPFDVLEHGVKIGDSRSPIAMAPGRHTVDLSNAELGFAATQVVDVQAGGSVTIVPKLPQGRANINARPWAEVFVDGKWAGETPLGNLALTIGPHQVVFRHPQLGEQLRTLVVTADSPARLSVEMKQ